MCTQPMPSASGRGPAGESTFMVEMAETSSCLAAASAASLVVLDELGRGTATYDGYSIAAAVLEHLACRLGARTLFATHYHDLTQEQGLLPRWGGDAPLLAALQHHLLPCILPGHVDAMPASLQASCIPV